MNACNTHVYVCTYEMSTTLQALNENPSEGKGLPRLSSQPTWLPMFIEATSRLPHACSVVDVQVAGLPLVYVNQAWEALTGYARAEVLGHNCRLLQGAETEEAAVAELVRSIRQRRPCVVTLTNYRKDGGRFANELSLHPVFDSRGVYRYIVGVSSDANHARMSEPVAHAMLTAVSMCICMCICICIRMYTCICICREGGRPRMLTAVRLPY